MSLTKTSLAALVVAGIGGALAPAAQAQCPASCDGTYGEGLCTDPFKCAIVEGFTGQAQGTTVQIQMFYYPGMCLSSLGRATFHRNGSGTPYLNIGFTSAELVLPWDQVHTAYVLAQLELEPMGYDLSQSTSAFGSCFAAMIVGDDPDPLPPPPDTTITLPTPSDPTESRDATFTFISSSPNSTFEYRLDLGPWVFNGTTATVTFPGPLSFGEHQFDVRATDEVPQTDPSPASFAWQIVPAATGTVLSSGTNPSVPGANVLLAATVGSSVGTPVGTVTFRNGGTTIGSDTLSGGGATLSAPFTAGTHSLTAEFASTDGNHAGSTSEPVTQVVTSSQLFFSSFSTCALETWVDDGVNFFTESPCPPEFGAMKFSSNVFDPAAPNVISVIPGMTGQALRIFKGGPHVAGNSPAVRCELHSPVTSADVTVTYRVQRKSASESGFFATILGPDNWSVTTINWISGSPGTIRYRVGDGVSNDSQSGTSVPATGVVNAVDGIVTVTVVVHLASRTFDITITDGTNTHASSANPFAFADLSEINAVFFENGGSADAVDTEHWVDDVQVFLP